MIHYEHHPPSVIQRRVESWAEDARNGRVISASGRRPRFIFPLVFTTEDDNVRLAIDDTTGTYTLPFGILNVPEYDNRGNQRDDSFGPLRLASSFLKNSFVDASSVLCPDEVYYLGMIGGKPDERDVLSVPLLVEFDTTSSNPSIVSRNCKSGIYRDMWASLDEVEAFLLGASEGIEFTTSARMILNYYFENDTVLAP